MANKIFNKAALVINTHSKRGDKLFFNVLDMFDARDFKFFATFAVRKPKKLKKIINDLCEDGCDLIIIGGGDGTISSVIHNFAHKDITLGILPLGTANSFTRTLNIPLDIREAVNSIVDGKVIKVDLGKINNTYFSNSANIGFSALVAKYANKNLKRMFGVPGYFLGSIKPFMAHKYFEVKFIEGKTITKMKVVDIYITNGQFHGSVVMVPDAKLNNRALNVIAIKGISKIDWLKGWYSILRKSQKEMNNIEIFQTQKMVIETLPRKTVDIDGEIAMKTPITISVEPQSLNVIVPN